MNPFISFLRTNWMLLTGQVRFPRGRVGQVLTLEDGQNWIIFREVQVSVHSGRAAGVGAVFRPRFHVAGMSVRANILFSLLPIPFFLGLPGFRSKLWLYHPENGDFQGIYEWDSIEAAERYAGSFAMRFMTHRSVPGSVSCQIIRQ
jgi:hypothetical protein